MVSMPKRVEIRPFSPADVSAVANLLGQLGYPVESEALVLERHAALADDVQQAVLVAVCEGQLVGLVQMARVCLLASEGYVEVHALVVDEAARGQGVALRCWRRYRRGPPVSVICVFAWVRAYTASKHTSFMNTLGIQSGPASPSRSV
jgi:GNAT superfamily N-acetyltransferase